MKESLRFLHNARNILKKTPREGVYYTDLKPVREACATAYLSVLLAIDEYLLSQGVTRKELPKSVEGYQKALRKHLSIRNGKLFKDFDYLYDTLHIVGYYRGLLYKVETVRDAMNVTQQFIQKLGR